MDTRDRDCEASHLQASGLTWVEVAERLGLANGGVARRCAMRHRERFPNGFDETPPAKVKQPDYLTEMGRRLGKAVAEDLAGITPVNDPDDSSDTVKRVARDQITINGRIVGPNTEISIRGESGRFTFRYSDRPDEVTVWGGDPQYEKWRTFKIDRVRTVHRKPTRRKNVEALEEEAA